MKIICIGRNYDEHIRELGNERPEEPVLFLKPDSALVLDNRNVRYPSFTSDIHHEVEIVLRISKAGKDVSVENASNHFDAVALGIDFTARDVQSRLKAKGLPWEIAKAFDDAAPVSSFNPIENFSRSEGIFFSLKVDGELRQSGDTRQMIYNFEEIIHWSSRFFQLNPGDLIFTGTPSGVGPVHKGNRLEGFLSGEKMLDFMLV
jgi:acylpyruvate hydrolase